MSFPGQNIARRTHYKGFYLSDSCDPVAVVYGNCQAEAVRVVLSGSPTFPFELVRLPPVHELNRHDLPHLSRLLRRCRLLLSQPVRAGYRGLPIGTDDLRPWLPPDARVVRWPVFRYAGLHPFTTIVRHPAGTGAEPPIVPYHDLRTVALAAGRRWRPTGPVAFRSVAAASIAELHRREADLDVQTAHLVAGLGAKVAHVINHPGNDVVLAIARGLQQALGLEVDAADPGRTLLGRVRAPLEQPVLEALDLPDAPLPHWVLDGRPRSRDEIEAAHLTWYEDHPECVTAAIERYGDRMAILGL